MAGQKESVMNLPTSSTRGFFEILMPGIFLLLNVVVTAYILSLSVAPELLPFINTAISYCANPAVVISLLLVLGYPVGVALRLLKNAKIDARSASYIGLFHPKDRDAPYLKDEFFYGNWMHAKCRSRLPAEAARFYEEYWADKDTGDRTKNTAFFNFCKTIVSKNDPQSAIEIYAAEALCRFVAGSYYALQVSVALMLINSFCLFIIVSVPAAALPLIAMIVYLSLLHVILKQYRLLRCKEVDTVFNACFVNSRHFEDLFPTHASRLLLKNTQSPEYEIRKDVILTAWGERWTNDRLIQSLDLNKLILGMKENSHVNPYLSSLYFSGSDVDHPYFLENTKLAIGLAVLPEDSLKAGTLKRHPHQTEIIIVLQGSLCLHYKKNDDIAEKVLNEGDSFVIAKGICHGVYCADESDAAYLFIKTNPSEEPRSQPCSTKKAIK